MGEERRVCNVQTVEFDGLFSIKDVTKSMFDFFTDRGYIFNEKLQTTKVSEKGKDYVIKGEFKKELNYYATSLIPFDIKAKGVVDVDVVRDKHKVSLNKGKISIVIDGCLVTDLEGRYEVSVLMMIFKAFSERFFFKSELDQLKEVVIKDHKKAVSVARGLLNLQKYN